MASVSEPVVSGGLVVAAGTDDCAISRLTVAAVQAATGRLVWQRAVATRNPCAYDVPLHVTDGIVVAGGRLGDSGPEPSPCAVSGAAAAGPRAVGLDLATGRQRWQEPAAAGLVIAATSDTLIARGAKQGCLVGLDAASGRLRWTVTAPVSPLFATTAADSVFVEGQVAGGTVAVGAVDLGTGRKRWQVALPPDPRGGIGPFAAGDVVVAGTSTIVGLDPSTGRELWRATEHDDLHRTAVDHGLLLVAHLTGQQSTIEALDPRTGGRRWQSKSDMLLFAVAPPVVTDGTVFVALTVRSAAAFMAANGAALWTVSGTYAAAAITADAAYLTAPTVPRNRPQED